MGTAVLTFAVLNALTWAGVLVDETETMEAAGSAGQPAALESTRSEPAALRPATEAETRKSAPPSPTLVITARRGDCWVEARAGSARGRLLYAGLLVTGRSLRFVRRKVWLRLGAASNVDLLLNGRESKIPAGTVELTLPAGPA